MGNAASTVTKETRANEEAPEPTSGVFLSEGLHSKILSEFQSNVLKEEWEKHQKYMIAKGNARRLEEFRSKEKVDQHLNTFREKDRITQQRLDQRIDELQAEFFDTSTALQFDLNRIDQKLSSTSFKGGIQSSCLGPRSAVAKCFRDESGAGCEDFVKELERCVEDAVVLRKQ